MSAARTGLMGRAGPFLGSVAVPVLAGVLAVGVIVTGWQGTDVAAHVFRSELVEREGFAAWNNYWFGGHHTVGYGVLTPVLAGVLGLGALAVLAAVASAAMVDQLIRAGVGGPRWAASVWFAVGTATNVIVGRVPFAVGMAIGLGALLAAQRRRFGIAVGLALATVAASAVASVFLGLIAASWAFTADRADRGRVVVLAVAALAPVGVVAWWYPQGGTFPFRSSALFVTLLACAATVVLVPARYRLVRLVAAGYAAAAVVLFVVPTPLGANAARLAMYAAGPVMLALVPFRSVAAVRRAPVRLAAVVALVGVAAWQWSPAVSAVSSTSEPSTTREFYEPLLDHLDDVGVDELNRIEVVPTRHHWESAYVAMQVPLARGWERQLDRRFNDLFYDSELSAERYWKWLDDNGVEYVALANAPLDPAGEAEAELIETGLPFLEPTWSSRDWQVWKVVGATGIVDGPAELIELGADHLVLDVDVRADLEIAVRASEYWVTAPSTCVGETDDGWIVLHDVPPGVVELYRDEAALVVDPAAGECPSTNPGR